MQSGCSNHGHHAVIDDSSHKFHFLTSNSPIDLLNNMQYTLSGGATHRVSRLMSNCVTAQNNTEVLGMSGMVWNKLVYRMGQKWGEAEKAARWWWDNLAS